MAKFEYFDPFAVGLVFLAHRCSDHKYSNYLAKVLGTHFDIYYSCDDSNPLSDPVLNREKLVASDLVLVLAGPTSFDKKSILAHEFSIAQILKIRGKLAMGIVQLDETKIPTAYSDYSFSQFRWSHRAHDAKKLISAIKRTLAESTGLGARHHRKAHNEKIYFSEMNPALIVDLIHDFKGNHLLPFNAPLQAFNMGVLWIRHSKGLYLSHLRNITPYFLPLEC